MRATLLGRTITTSFQTTTSGSDWGLFSSQSDTSLKVRILEWSLAISKVTTPVSDIEIIFATHINDIVATLDSLPFDPDQPADPQLWRPQIQPTLGLTRIESYIAPDDRPFSIHRSYDPMQAPSGRRFWIGAIHPSSTFTMAATVVYQNVST